MTNRARLTPVDVVFAATSLAMVAFFAQPVYTALNDNADALGTGAAYMFQMLMPALIVTLLFVVFATAVGGTS